MLQDSPCYAYLPARDVARARQFHEGKLGFRAKREVAALKARGVAFENYDLPGAKSPSGVITAGGAKAAWFKDSEGNILAIVQNA